MSLINNHLCLPLPLKQENYMKKLKERPLKDNQEAQTLKEFTDYFQQSLNDPASMQIAIKKTMHIMKEHNIFFLEGLTMYKMSDQKYNNGYANQLDHFGHNVK